MDVARTIYSKIISGVKSSSPWTSPSWGGTVGSSIYTNDKAELSAYEKIVWFAACIDKIAADTSNVDFRFVRTGTDDTLEFRDIPEEILLPITNGFGNLLNFSKLNELIMSHKKLTGNGYLFRCKGTGYGQVNNICDKFFPLRPDFVKPILTPNKMMLLYYEVRFEDGSIFNIPPENIIHFIQNPIFNPFVGVGNVTKARLVAENETQSDEYVNDFMQKKASPSLFISESTNRNVDDIDRLRDLIEKKYERKENAGKIMYMSGTDIQMQQLSLSQKDMQFLEGRVFNRQAILSINRVPPVALAIPEGSNRAVGGGMMRNYYKSNINPEIKSTEDTYNMQFVHPIDPSITLKFGRHSTGDITEIVKEIASGIISPNRGAELLGEEQIDTKEMNNHYLPANLIPIQLAGENMKATEGEPEKEPENNGDGKSKVDLHNPKNVKEILERFDKSATRPKKFQRKFLKKALEDRNAVEDKYFAELAKFFEHSLNRILENIKDNELLLKSAFLDYKNESNKELTENSLSLIYKINEDLPELERVAKNLHTSGVQRSVISLNSLMDENVSFTINNPFIKNAIGRLGKKIKRVNDATQKEVERILLKEIKNGGNVVTLTDQLQDKFSDFQGYRARRIARTEARLAWDAGAEVMYRDIGVKRIDIVGCTEFEPQYDCGKQNVSINLLSTLEFHPNHIGAPAPSELPG